MGTSSLQADSLPQLRKKPQRAFRLPSFRRSSGGERQEVAKSADEKARSVEEGARVQKAAAWQWYTRGVGEAVVPTKRPPLGNSPPSQAPTDAKSGVDGTGKGDESTTNNRNVLQKNPLEPPHTESPRAVSRFKAEAGFTRRTNSGAPPPPTLPEPSDGPSTPLYDEFELSGLRTQMADFVQRLQHQPTKDNEQSPAVAVHQKSKPPRPNLTAATSVSTDHHQTKAPPPVAAAAASDHQLTKLPPSAAPVASTIPFHMRPVAALHRLFCKVASGSIMKSTKNSLNSSPAVFEPEVLPEKEDNNSEYHYHHYIHHHHHHYHYGETPEESPATIRSSGRRHSESSGILPRIPSLWEAESDDDEEEVEESPIKAYLARRRRHSDSFAGQLPPKKAAFDEDEGMKGETAKMASPLQLQRWYKSERFSPNKIPIMVSTDRKQPAAAGSTDEFGKELAGMKSRRHSAENYLREEACLERKAQGGGKSGGGTYKLGGAAGGAMPLVRRRHSESSQMPEAVQYEMGKRPSPRRPYWQTPSARYDADLLERYSGVPAPVNAPIIARPRNAALPPLYPQ